MGRTVKCQVSHRGLLEATWAIWQTARTTTFGLIGSRRLSALPFCKRPSERHAQQRTCHRHAAVDNALQHCSLHRLLRRITPEAFQYLLDKRESRQAITVFLDQASCWVINFYMEASDDPATEGDTAGL